MAGGRSGARRENHRLLELDVHFVPLNVHKIVALIVSPDMVRSTSPGSRYALAHPPGYAWCRSYWTSLMRRKRCWIVQTLLAATNPTHPTPILAPS